MSILLVGLPTTLISSIIEFTLEHLAKPKTRRGGDISKFQNKRRRH